MAKLTRAEIDTLRELATFHGKNRCYWWRVASCRKLKALGFAEDYAPPSVLERPRLAARPFRITPAGLSALQKGEGK